MEMKDRLEVNIDLKSNFDSSGFTALNSALNGININRISSIRLLISSFKELGKVSKIDIGSLSGLIKNLGKLSSIDLSKIDVSKLNNMVTVLVKGMQPLISGLDVSSEKGKQLVSVLEQMKNVLNEINKLGGANIVKALKDEQKDREKVFKKQQQDEKEAKEKALQDQINISSKALKDEQKDREKALKKQQQDEKEALRESERNYQQYRQSLEQTMSSLSLMGATISAVGIAIVGLSSIVVKTAADFEQYQMKIVAVSGSLSESQELLKYFKEYAEKTPFNIKEIVDAGSQLKIYNQEVRETLPLAAALASAFGGDLNKAAINVGRALSGSTYGFRVLRESFGVATHSLEKFGARVENGRLILNRHADDAKVAGDALKKYVNFKYGDIIALQANTAKTALANLQDVITNIAQEVGKDFLPIFKSLLISAKSLLELVRPFSGVLSAILAIITSIGVPLVAFGGAIGGISFALSHLSRAYLVLQAALSGGLGIGQIWKSYLEMQNSEIQRQNALLATNTTLVTSNNVAKGAGGIAGAAGGIVIPAMSGGVGKATGAAVDAGVKVGKAAGKGILAGILGMLPTIGKGIIAALPTIGIAGIAAYIGGTIGTYLISNWREQQEKIEFQLREENKLYYESIDVIRNYNDRLREQIQLRGKLAETPQKLPEIKDIDIDIRKKVASDVISSLIQKGIDPKEYLEKGRGRFRDLYKKIRQEREDIEKELGKLKKISETSLAMGKPQDLVILENIKELEERSNLLHKYEKNLKEGLFSYGDTLNVLKDKIDEDRKKLEELRSKGQFVDADIYKDFEDKYKAGILFYNIMGKKQNELNKAQNEYMKKYYSATVSKNIGVLFNKFIGREDEAKKLESEYMKKYPSERDKDIDQQLKNIEKYKKSYKKLTEEEKESLKEELMLQQVNNRLLTLNKQGLGESLYAIDVFRRKRELERSIAQNKNQIQIDRERDLREYIKKQDNIFKLELDRIKNIKKEEQAKEALDVIHGRTSIESIVSGSMRKDKFEYQKQEAERDYNNQVKFIRMLMDKNRSVDNERVKLQKQKDAFRKKWNVSYKESGEYGIKFDIGDVEGKKLLRKQHDDIKKAIESIKSRESMIKDESVSALTSLNELHKKRIENERKEVEESIKKRESYLTKMYQNNKYMIQMMTDNMKRDMELYGLKQDDYKKLFGTDLLSGVEASLIAKRQAIREKLKTDISPERKEELSKIEEDISRQKTEELIRRSEEYIKLQVDSSKNKQEAESIALKAMIDTLKYYKDQTKELENQTKLNSQIIKLQQQQQQNISSIVKELKDSYVSLYQDLFKRTKGDYEASVFEAEIKRQKLIMDIERKRKLLPLSEQGMLNQYQSMVEHGYNLDIEEASKKLVKQETKTGFGFLSPDEMIERLTQSRSREYRIKDNLDIFGDISPKTAAKNLLEMQQEEKYKNVNMKSDTVQVESPVVNLIGDIKFTDKNIKEDVNTNKKKTLKTLGKSVVDAGWIANASFNMNPGMGV